LFESTFTIYSERLVINLSIFIISSTSLHCPVVATDERKCNAT